MFNNNLELKFKPEEIYVRPEAPTAAGVLTVKYVDIGKVIAEGRFARVLMGETYSNNERKPVAVKARKSKFCFMSRISGSSQKSFMPGSGRLVKFVNTLV